MPKYEHTQIFSLATAHEVDLFYAMLREMKATAPRSLQLTIAVTASRAVTFLASNPARVPKVQHPGEDLERLNRVLAEVKRRRNLEERKARRREKQQRTQQRRRRRRR